MARHLISITHRNGNEEMCPNTFVHIVYIFVFEENEKPHRIYASDILQWEKNKLCFLYWP